MTTTDERILPDLEDEARMESIDDVMKALAKVDFAPSCVDMGWRWEVRAVWFTHTKEGLQLEVSEQGTMMRVDHAGFLIRTTFLRPDRDAQPNDPPADGLGAWHHVPPGATSSAVQKRAFVAAKAILEHELMESFKVGGVRPFDPHNTITELVRIQGARYVKSIP